MLRIYRFLIIASVVLFIFISACKKESVDRRTFSSSFESVEDFSGFYLTPQGYLNTSYHELSDSVVHGGSFAHKAWITGSNPPTTPSVNNNHRGYPTIQFQKTAEGSFSSPCYITFWVWLDMDLQPSTTGGDHDWFSFATFTDDETDSWNRTVLVNLSHEGIVHLQHTPNQGEQEHLFQTGCVIFPQKKWVELKIYLDFSADGYAKVWQDGVLVSHAKVEGVNNRLAQAHFGMYCPPQMVSGVVYTDDLTIEMVSGE